MSTSAGVWVRVSTGGQDEANQVPDIERHCAARGYVIARRYTVHGKSASKGKQQRYLDQALSDMRAGHIKVLIIWHSDRIERRAGKALLDVLAEFDAAGGRVESVKEPTLGQLDMGSQVTTFLAGLVNHDKSRHLAEQVGLAHDRIREAGGFIGRAPWGYRVTGKKYAKRIVPTAEGRRLVPEIFARCIAGESTLAIARWLAAETGRPWWSRVVQGMLRNQAYTGHVRNGEGTIVATCEHLVDAAVFERAGKALAARQRGEHKRGPVVEGRALLAGICFCLNCGGPMYRILCPTTAGGVPVKRAYYRCAGKGPARKGCGTMVRLAELDEIVDWTVGHFSREVPATRWIEGQNWNAEIADVKVRIRGLDPDAEDYDARHAALRAELAELKGRPSTEGHEEEYGTGVTYAERWNAQSGPERTAWLKSTGITVWAASGRDSGGERHITAELRDRHGTPITPREFAA